MPSHSSSRLRKTVHAAFYPPFLVPSELHFWLRACMRKATQAQSKATPLCKLLLVVNDCSSNSLSGLLQLSVTSFAYHELIQSVQISKWRDFVICWSLHLAAGRPSLVKASDLALVSDRSWYLGLYTSSEQKLDSWLQAMSLGDTTLR